MSYHYSAEAEAPSAEQYNSEADVEGEEALHGQTPRNYLPDVEEEPPQPAAISQHEAALENDRIFDQYQEHQLQHKHTANSSYSHSSGEPQPQPARAAPAPLNMPVIRRSSAAVGSRGGTPRGSTPRSVGRSTSVLSAGNTKEDLRRRSLVDNARYQNERRASSIANTVGTPGSARRSARMTPSEAFAVEQIAYNDMRRQEVKDRADDIEAEREAIVIEAEIEKEKMLYERGMTRAIAQEHEMQQRAIERQSRTEAAAARRAQQEAERLASLQDKLNNNEERVTDAYKVLEAKRRYSTQEVAGGTPTRGSSQTGPRRSSQAGAVAPRRASAAQQPGEAEQEGDRRASLTAKQMWGRRNSAASHDRVWH